MWVTDVISVVSPLQQVIKNLLCGGFLKKKVNIDSLGTLLSV